MTSDCPYRRKAFELLLEARAASNGVMRGRLIHRASMWHELSLTLEQFPAGPGAHGRAVQPAALAA
jgi:hypothetical protein